MRFGADTFRNGMDPLAILSYVGQLGSIVAVVIAGRYLLRPVFRMVAATKLVEVFNRNEVTFVSVTQSFNTTTSMGVRRRWATTCRPAPSPLSQATRQL